MIEKEIEVKTFRVRAFCECGGEFKDTGCVLMSYPPQYVHACEKCNKKAHFSKSYPTIKYKEI